VLRTDGPTDESGGRMPIPFYNYPTGDMLDRMLEWVRLEGVRLEGVREERKLSTFKYFLSVILVPGIFIESLVRV